MSDPIFDPTPHLHDTLDAGDYAIVLRHDDREQRVTTHEHIDEAYDGGGQPRIVLHRPQHVFLHPTVLGARMNRSGDSATIDMDGSSVQVSELEPVEGLTDTLHGRLADGGPDAYDVVMHPSSRVAPGEVPPFAAVHGFRFWNHIGWFCDMNADGAWPTDFPQPVQDLAPPGFPTAPPSGAAATESIGLIDNGVDKKHPWLSGAEVSGDGIAGNPAAAHASHGTMVAGVLRQSAPSSPIVSKRVTLPDPSSAHERMVVQALQQLQTAGVWNAVMAFGGETLSDWSELKTAIQTYVGNGGLVFAAAGNKAPAAARDVFAPASFAGEIANVYAVAGGPADKTFGPGEHPTVSDFYDWSNGGDWVTDIVSDTTDPRNQGWLFTSYNTVPGGSSNTYAAARGTSLLVAMLAARVVVGSAWQNPYPARI